MSAAVAAQAADLRTREVAARATSSRPAQRPSTPVVPVPRPAPALALVPRRRDAVGLAPFLLVMAGLFLAGLLGLLALNTALAQDAFHLHELKTQGKQLTDREQELSTAVADLESPAGLAERAGSLGLVPGGAPAFLRLSDGAVLGEPTPAVAPVPAPTE